MAEDADSRESRREQEERRVATEGSSGHLIVITGIPSVGKTTVSQAVEAQSSSIRHFDGDRFIRSTAPGLPARGPPRILALMLDELDAM